MAKQSTPPPAPATQADEPARTPGAPEPTPVPKPVPGVRPISLKAARRAAGR